jgi:anti-sigma factor RsiW
VNACGIAMDLMLDCRGLTTSGRAKLDAHLADCAACSEEFAMMEELDACFAEARTRAPAGFADRVVGRTRREEAVEFGAGRACAFLGALIGAQSVVILCLGEAFRRWASGLFRGVATALGDRIMPVMLDGGRAFVREVGRLRLPAVPLRVNWLYVVAAIALIAAFAVFTMYQEEKRHA